MPSWTHVCNFRHIRFAQATIRLSNQARLETHNVFGIKRADAWVGPKVFVGLVGLTVPAPNYPLIPT